jgi:predicted PurR-regulated permease PerM
MKFKWDKKYLYWGITAFCVIIVSAVFVWVLNNGSGIKSFLKLLVKIMSPVIYGLIIAYLLNKILVFFENTMFKKLGGKLFPEKPRRAATFSRVVGIFVTVVLTFGVVGGLLALVLPQIYSSIEKLVIQMPEYVNVAINWLERFVSDNPELEATIANMLGNITDYFTNWIETSILPTAQNFITNLTNGIVSVIKEIFNLLIGIIISVYILYQKETFCAQMKKVLFGLFKRKWAIGILKKTHFLDKTFGNFITGKIIDSLIIGMICYIVLTIIGMPYTVLVSVIVGVTNIIPFVGPFIGAIPSAFLILLESPVKCLIFIVFIIVLQQFDGNVLGPKILGSTVGLSGFWILFAILLFGGLFGFWGMLLGVPVLAVIYTELKRFIEKRLRAKNLPYKTVNYADVTCARPERAPVSGPSVARPPRQTPPVGSDSSSSCDGASPVPSEHNAKERVPAGSAASSRDARDQSDSTSTQNNRKE